MPDQKNREPNFIQKRKSEPNFIEKRRQWKSKMESPLSRRTLMMVLPALVLSVFVMMSAPYLKLMMEKFMQKGDDMSYPMELNIDDEKVVEKQGPPPDPDMVLREEYRELLESAETTGAEAAESLGANPGFAKDRGVAIEPVDVELPSTMTELRAASKPAGTPSE